MGGHDRGVVAHLVAGCDDVAWLLDPSWLLTGLVPTPRLGRDLRWQDAGAGRHVIREAWGVDRDAAFSDPFRVLPPP